ncbi:hypothetical protein [Pseudonocardia kunmingensis]|uniref:Uncharacterized protein n=1 Tax=Pseudonocardia kunmingensis TaxID=630975 RepID=A0A543D1C6_9PSEU|nr:hypothetical protein [Pseudonocardia kunmingensis]TQM03144.1 hypothetical protein FB558_7794 [Pseudonocardia kunmingensis]
MTDSEHDPVESARPSLGRRDQPDALRPDAEPGPDRKLPPDDDPVDDDPVEVVPDEAGPDDHGT